MHTPPLGDYTHPDAGIGCVIGVKVASPVALLPPSLSHHMLLLLLPAMGPSKLCGWASAPVVGNQQPTSLRPASARHHACPKLAPRVLLSTPRGWPLLLSLSLGWAWLLS